ncbi:MAG: 3-hydroxy acid dehydrogenase/malonic semialdehyde reductase [Cyclobacteriaceae bacterium]|jgi:3-hydroxy acid dehydrogenase/malonic semialdehyde reductase
MQKTVLITGATSGIGKATAEILAGKNHRLILCGRRKERLSELEATLGKITQIHTLSFDVTKKNEVFSAIASLPNDWKKIDILINNAGNAHGYDPVHEGNMDDWEAMIDINLKGLLYVTKAIVTDMVLRKSGHIINIGSIAGIESYANGSVYNASKYAVDGFTKAMRQDLVSHNIKVSEIKPGAVNTEFSNVRFKGNTERAAKVYEGFEPLTAKDIAEIIEFIISRPAHVNLADTLILPTAQASATVVHRTK